VSALTPPLSLRLQYGRVPPFFVQPPFAYLLLRGHSLGVGMARRGLYRYSAQTRSTRTGQDSLLLPYVCLPADPHHEGNGDDQRLASERAEEDRVARLHARERAEEDRVEEEDDAYRRAEWERQKLTGDRVQSERADATRRMLEENEHLRIAELTRIQREQVAAVAARRKREEIEHLRIAELTRVQRERAAADATRLTQEENERLRNAGLTRVQRGQAAAEVARHTQREDEHLRIAEGTRVQAGAPHRVHGGTVGLRAAREADLIRREQVETERLVRMEDVRLQDASQARMRRGPDDSMSRTWGDAYRRQAATESRTRHVRSPGFAPRNQTGPGENGNYVHDDILLQHGHTSLDRMHPVHLQKRAVAGEQAMHRNHIANTGSLLAAREEDWPEGDTLTDGPSGSW
jgi:hypothetical protein